MWYILIAFVVAISSFALGIMTGCRSMNDYYKENAEQGQEQTLEEKLWEEYIPCEDKENVIKTVIRVVEEHYRKKEIYVKNYKWKQL